MNEVIRQPQRYITGHWHGKFMHNQIILFILLSFVNADCFKITD